MAKAGGNLLNTYVADYVVFDLETTGISPKTDEVVEISAVKVEHGKVTDEFSTLVNPKRRIPYGASRVNGITVGRRSLQRPLFTHDNPGRLFINPPGISHNLAVTGEKLLFFIRLFNRRNQPRITFVHPL